MRIVSAEPGTGMSESEVVDFLVGSHLNMQLGTVDEKGDPYIHTLWYHFDRDSKKFYIATLKDSKKAQNLRKRATVFQCR